MNCSTCLGAEPPAPVSSNLIKLIIYIIIQLVLTIKGMKFLGKFLPLFPNMWKKDTKKNVAVVLAYQVK